MDGRQNFEVLKLAIDEACKRQAWRHAIETAERCGMTGGQTDSKWTLAYRFTHSDETGAMTTLTYIAIDRCKTYMIVPDRNQLTVVLALDGKQLDSHTNFYDD
jgi:hypothetical protein